MMDGVPAFGYHHQRLRDPDLRTCHPIASRIAVYKPNPQNARPEQAYVMHNNDHPEHHDTFRPNYYDYASLLSSSSSTSMDSTWTPSMMATLDHIGTLSHPMHAGLPSSMASPFASTTSYTLPSGPSMAPSGEVSSFFDHNPNWEVALGSMNGPYSTTGSATLSWPAYTSQAQPLTTFDHILVPSPPSCPSIDQFTHYESFPGDQNLHSMSSLSPPHTISPTSTFAAISQDNVSPALQIGPDRRPYFGFYRAPMYSRSPSHRRKRAARAILFDGRWIDEEELLEGLGGPDFMISVHECHWDEERSPCHLWVAGDKSCINSHIQKWHGGKPGGDKLETDCRWSNCHKKMNKESISRHIVTIHLGKKWRCQGCSEEIARKDSYGRHAERSGKQACREAGAFVKYDARGYAIDCRVALNSGGDVRYAL